MNYFLAIYLGISIVTIFTNNPILVFAVELDTQNPISYVNYIDYNQSQAYFQDFSNPLEIDRQAKESLRQQQIQIQAETDRQIQEIQRQQQQQRQIAKQKAILKQKKVAKVTPPKLNAVTNSGVESLIYYWTSVYGGDPGYHIKIAKCESGMNPNSIGGGGLYLGVFQQHSKYWPARAARAGFAGASPFDANANVAVSIHMMRTAGYGHWGCA